MADSPPEETSRAEDLLLAFLEDHEADCPVCGYNLKALTRPICPECGQKLTLTVGAMQLRLKWLLIAIAPGFFSGISAFFWLLPTVGQYLGDRRLSFGVITMVLLDLFGWCSLAATIGIAVKRSRFLSQPIRRQRWIAFGIWAVHVGALGFFILLVMRYLI